MSGRPAVATAILLVLAGATSVLARCGDAEAVADARAQVASDCSCNGAASHRDYVRCATAVATVRIAAGSLPRECRSAVRRCASRSTCGRPGAVACCRTRASGVTRCSIRRSADSCTAPPGAVACVGSAPSCCDACTDGGCVSTTTVTTTSSTTSTSSPELCGTNFPQCNGSCGPGAQCWQDEFPAVGCQCLPIGVTPCIGSAYPECGGTCPGGDVCQPTVAFFNDSTISLCACVDPGSACVPGAATATCPGKCPVSHTCGISVAFEECFCQPALSCSGGSPFPSCGGSCPAGSTCAPFRLGSIFANCVCVPDATPCDASCGGGLCPAGSACTFTLSGGVPTCGCESLP